MADQRQSEQEYTIYYRIHYIQLAIILISIHRHVPFDILSRYSSMIHAGFKGTANNNKFNQLFIV